VKLLLDQNISRKLVPLLHEEFPDSAQVAELDLAQSTDRQIWDCAGQNAINYGFRIVRWHLHKL
jgi:predicted nuclease of predicted toxin-antitoxin system